MDLFYTAQHAFVPESPQELGLKAGEVVQSKSKPREGWLSVTHCGTLQSGMVPFSYLTLVLDPIKPGVVYQSNVAADHGECPVCFDALCNRPAAVLLQSSSGSKRACRHFAHLGCVRSARACPVCNAQFARAVELPNFDHEPEAWFAMVDFDQNGTLCKREVYDVIKTLVPVDIAQLTQNIDALWPRWDLNRSGLLEYRELCDPKVGLLAFVRMSFLRQRGKEPPKLATNKELWFQFWDEDCSGALSKLEMTRALVKTFGLSPHPSKLAELGQVLDAVWGLFDSDNSGSVELKEFLQPGDGLGDTLVASLSFHQQ